MYHLLPFLRRCAIFFPLLLIVALSPVLNAQRNAEKYARQAFMVSKAIEKYHFKPQPLDDRLSKNLNSEMFMALDPSGLYFTKAEEEAFSKWDTQIDDEIRGQDTAYLSALSELYKRKLVWADSIITVLSLRPLDFNEKDTMHFSGRSGKAQYAANEKALVKRWKSLLKYQALDLLYTSSDQLEKPFAAPTGEVLKKESDARARVTLRNHRSIRRVLDHPDGYYDYVASVYIGRFISLSDPHTSFFSPSEKQEFESSISVSELSFGFHYDENENGEIEVMHISPGGSAWKSNQLHKGDVILKIRADQGREIDLAAAGTEAALELMASFKENEAEFTIRKTNGQIKTVILIKSKVRSDENVVKSYILEGEKKIGYISLPSFYTEWENNSPSGCANDVAKEIVKLQEENIEGLVMDLRYNGGGSVREAMGLIGLFVDEGPLCIYKTRNDKPVLLKDFNRRTAYSGPLVVMVNGMSASASEIFSASLQDYNRAVLVGSSTYGKATGQIIVPLDTSYALGEIMAGALSGKESKLGYLKITTEGFYRVTNATHQKRGVSVDIPLLEPYFYEDYKESSEPYAISNDSISKKVIYTPLPLLPLAELKSRSASRVNASKSFRRLTQINDSLRSEKDRELALPLYPATFSRDKQVREQLIEDMEKNLYDSATAFTVLNNQYDKKVIELDEFSKEINERSLKSILEDIYIAEAWFVLKDLITFGKN